MLGKKGTGVGVAVAVAILIAGCSSSGGGGSADTTTPASGSTTGSSVGSSPATNPDVAAALAAAKANVEKFRTFPTTISVTDPLPSAPPKGKTVVFLQCEQDQCHNQGDGIEEAAKAIGWNFKRLNFQAANPATLVAALKTALQYKPVGVYFSGSPQATYASMQDAYAKAGSFISESFDSVQPSGKGVIGGHGFDKDATALGTLLADAQVTDANGAPVKALFVTVPSYAVFKPNEVAYKAEIKKTCPDCTVDTVEATIPQLVSGQLTPAIVSAAKRISGLKYIVSVNGSFVAQLPQALKAAGLDGKFKIIAGQGRAADQQQVLSGNILYTASGPFKIGGWQDVDIAIRTVMGLPIPDADHRSVAYLLTKDNIGTPQDSYDLPKDYQEQFKKLWKVA